MKTMIVKMYKENLVDQVLFLFAKLTQLARGIQIKFIDLRCFLI